MSRGYEGAGAVPPQMLFKRFHDGAFPHYRLTQRDFWALRRQGVLTEQSRSRLEHILAHCPLCRSAKAASEDSPLDDYFRLELRPNDVLGTGHAAIQLIREIGSGAEGSVWRAVDSVKREVAVKVMLRETWSRNPELEMALRHLHQRVPDRSAAQSYLPTIHAIDGDDGWVWYTMDLADSAPDYTAVPYSLEREIQAISGENVIDYAYDVATRLLAAADWLHRFGLAHNDIKPQNFLRYGGKHWKLCDLGMIGSAQGRPALGTVNYFFNRAKNGVEADLAAIARTLFRVLTSNLENSDVQSQFDTWRTNSRGRSQSLSCYEALIRRVILPAWNRKVERRFASARDMLVALEECRAFSRKHQRTTVIGGNEFSVYGSVFVGRVKDMAVINKAWNSPPNRKINIVSLIGQGGEGKTTLLLTWLHQLAKADWRGAKRVFRWTFYRQGGESGATENSDAFFEAAFEFFGHSGDIPSDSWTKGETLAKLVGKHRNILVLDGLERLQFPPGSRAGHLKDRALTALLVSLALQNKGLCLLASRMRLWDLCGYEESEEIQGTCTYHPVRPLSIADGCKLLKQLGVKGSQAEFEKVVAAFCCHAYDLNLLGNFIVRCTANHQIVQPATVSLLDEDRHVRGAENLSGQQEGHGRRAIIRAYEDWLDRDSAYVATLRLLGLFPGPASMRLLNQLRLQPVIEGLTEAVIGLSSEEWLRTISELADLKLVSLLEDGSGVVAIDTHQLLRDHYADELRRRVPRAWREAHWRLCQNLLASSPASPNPEKDDLVRLYEAVVHACQAEKWVAAFDIYFDRIHQKDQNIAVSSFALYEQDRATLQHFFRSLWSEFAVSLERFAAGFLLDQASVDLRALGYPEEALELMARAYRLATDAKDWKSASRRARFLRSIALQLGKLDDMLTYGQLAVQWAENSQDLAARIASLAAWGDALHQLNRPQEARQAFEQAECLQARLDPDHPELQSVQAFRYYSFLLSVHEYDEVLRRVGDEPPPSEFASREDRMDMLGTALKHLARGRAHVRLMAQRPSSRAKAERSLRWAMSCLRDAGRQDHLPRGHLALAEYYLATGDLDAASVEADEAKSIAVRSAMNVHLLNIQIVEIELQLEKARRRQDIDAVTSALTQLDHVEDRLKTMRYLRRMDAVARLKAVARKLSLEMAAS